METADTLLVYLPAELTDLLCVSPSGLPGRKTGHTSYRRMLFEHVQMCLDVSVSVCVCVCVSE